MKRYRTHVPPFSFLRDASCALRSLSARPSAGAAHSRGWPAGGAVGSRSAAARKGSSTSRRSSSLWDPGSGGKPGPIPEGARGGAAWQKGRRDASSENETRADVWRNAPSRVGVQFPGHFAISGRRSGGCACGQGLGDRSGPNGACAPGVSTETSGHVGRGR